MSPTKSCYDIITLIDKLSNLPFSNTKLAILIIAMLFSNLNDLEAQTGPGGVGNDNTLNDVVWVAADQITAKPLEGEQVATWNDLLLRQTNDATDDGTAVFNLNIINGVPAIRINGNDDFDFGGSGRLNNSNTGTRDYLLVLRTGADVSSATEQVLYEGGGNTATILFQIVSSQIQIGFITGSVVNLKK
jgi:hypothetical protein